MDKIIDIREAAMRFADKLSHEFDVDQLVLFGSWARGNYQPDSYVDVAVILRKFPGDYMEIKLAMCFTAYDVLVETGVRIQPIPISAADWKDPERHANPSLLGHIALEGVTLWRS